MNNYIQDLINKTSDILNTQKMNINIYQTNDKMNPQFKQDIPSDNNSYISFEDNNNNKTSQLLIDETSTYKSNTENTYLTSTSTIADNNNISDDILTKVFVGGLSYSTDEESFRNYFSKYGSLTDWVIIKDSQTNKSRGFGFVKYSDSLMVDELMKNRPHILDSRRLDIKRSTPRKSTSPSSNQSITKLFIGNLNDSINETDLESYFSQYGKIMTVKVKRDKESNKSRRFGFIEFEDYDSVDKIVLLKKHTINSVNLNVEKAFANSSNTQQQNNKQNSLVKYRHETKSNKFIKNYNRQNFQQQKCCQHCLHTANNQIQTNKIINSSTSNNQENLNLQSNSYNMNSSMNNLYGSYNLTSQSVTNNSNETLSNMMNKMMYSNNNQNLSYQNQNFQKQSSLGPIRPRDNVSFRPTAPY
jgi:RNA recognition motif-containing protein